MVCIPNFYRNQCNVQFTFVSEAGGEKLSIKSFEVMMLLSIVTLMESTVNNNDDHTMCMGCCIAGMLYQHIYQ